MKDELREKRVNKIMQELIALEKLDNPTKADKKLYLQLEEELLEYGYKNIGNGYFGEI